MSAVNTVNTVDQTIATYANDNEGTKVTNSRVNDYNDCMSKTLETVVNPRKSLADIAGISFPDVPSIYVNDNNKG